MSAIADPIEACISEVDKARARAARIKSKQVTKADDRDYFKSVAYAWFKTHRPALIPQTTADSLEPIDSPFRSILDATGRSSARTTYVTAFKQAKTGLTSFRSNAVVAMPLVNSPEAAPDFTSLAADPTMKAILERRWSECQKCIRAHAPLAATVMMGGLLEALFVARANLMPNKTPLFRAKATPIDPKTKKPLALPEWTLRPYIDVAAEMGWISRSGKDVAAVLRDYRNYIHPEKERAHGVSLDKNDSSMFWEVTKSLARQLLASAATP